MSSVVGVKAEGAGARKVGRSTVKDYSGILLTPHGPTPSLSYKRGVKNNYTVSENVNRPCLVHFNTSWTKALVIGFIRNTVIWGSISVSTLSEQIRFNQAPIRTSEPLKGTLDN